MTTTRKVSGNGATALPTDQQLAVFGVLLDRLASAGTHGLQYGTARDLYAVGGYKKVLGFKEYLDKYERDGIAGQIVDKASETTWRNPPEISEPEQDEGTPFTEAWGELARRLSIWGAFEEADSKSRIGKYSVVLIGTAGGDDATLERELVRLSGPDDVLYLSTFDERYAEVKEWVSDPADERYGRPLIYQVDLSSDIPNFSGASMPGRARIHWSRCLHVAEGDVFGRPVLKRVWNDLEDLRKITTSTAEAFWQRVAGILGLEIDKEAMVDDDLLGEIDEKLQQMYHDLKKTFYMKGGKLYRVGDTEPNPEAAADLCMTLIAAGASPPIPKRILFGSETGERASTEDQKTWLGAIAERQKQHAEPRILRPFIDRLISIGALPRPGERGYEVVWPTMFAVPEKEVAEANALRARAAKDLTPVGGDPSLLVEVDEERSVWLKPRTADEASPFEGMPAAADDGADEPPAGGAAETEDE